MATREMVMLTPYIQQINTRTLTVRIDLLCFIGLFLFHIWPVRRGFFVFVSSSRAREIHTSIAPKHLQESEIRKTESNFVRRKSKSNYRANDQFLFSSCIYVFIIFCPMDTITITAWYSYPFSCVVFYLCSSDSIVTIALAIHLL